MAELRARRGIGHGGTRPLMSPRWLRVFRLVWWALVGRSARFPVGYGRTGSSDRQPGTRGSGSGEEYSGRSRRWRCPWGASVAPPPFFPPVEPAPVVRLAQHSALSALQPAETANGSPPASRKRVVLLPHAQIEPINTWSHNRRTGGPQA
jgi:hypothetical protein